MKNPRVALTFAEVQSPAIAPNPPLAMGRPAAMGLLPIADKTGSGFDDVLKFFKFSDADIKDIDQLKDSVLALASTVNWVMGAITTIKGVLTLLGVFDSAKDANSIQLAAIGKRIEAIYEYLENTAKNDEYRQAVTWRSKIGPMRTAIANLKNSRSPQNLSDVRTVWPDVQQAILQMLALPFGQVPFLRATYGYKYVPPAEPTHWIDYAYPFYMTQADGTGVGYGAPAQELQAQIFDPAYYLDVLVQAVEVRIAALAITEPAFRSTAYDREDLRQIYAGLDQFIANWQKSTLYTRIVGPINPAITSGGTSTAPAHLLSHPFAEGNRIPMGVIDPISGISAFEPDYHDGFDLHFVPWPGGQGGGYWILTNYDQAVASASLHQNQLSMQVRDHCGIGTLYKLRESLGSLIMGPNGSEFVDLSPVSFRAGSVEQTGDHESASLGIIGEYAGYGGRTYDGTRYVQYSAEKLFRIPMARRMDVSQIQLGYTLGIGLDDGQPEREIVLCPYSAASPNAQPFPTQAISQDLQSDAATVYDVYQSGFFSIDDEEQYENTGSVPTHFSGKPWSIALAKQRLYANPRPGKIRISVAIDFEFDQEDPDGSFVGYANVSIRNVDPQQFRDGFILYLRVYETVNGTTGVANPDVQMTRLADSMTLHFAPTFLILGSGYFSDRDDGLENFGKVIGDVNRHYVRYRAPSGHPDPMSKVVREAALEQAMVKAFHDFRQRAPQEEAGALLRFQPPVVKQVLKRVAAGG